MRLLFDAGICGVEAQRRLSTLGRDIRTVHAVIISHDHADHVRYAGVYHRKYALPIHITPLTLDRAVARHNLRRLGEVNYFSSGGTLTFGDVSVQAIPTPHDGADGSVFVVSSQGKRFGILTDLGHAFSDLYSLMATLDAVFIESNYDPGLLAAGTYPASLKRRIAGEGGHLSNADAAELLLCGRRLKWACLAHLSENNNSASVALKTVRRTVGDELTLHVAGRYGPTGILNV